MSNISPCRNGRTRPPPLARLMTECGWLHPLRFPKRRSDRAIYYSALPDLSSKRKLRFCSAYRHALLCKATARRPVVGAGTCAAVYGEGASRPTSAAGGRRSVRDRAKRFLTVSMLRKRHCQTVITYQPSRRKARALRRSRLMLPDIFSDQKRRLVAGMVARRQFRCRYRPGHTPQCPSRTGRSTLGHRNCGCPWQPEIKNPIRRPRSPEQPLERVHSEA